MVHMAATKSKIYKIIIKKRREDWFDPLPGMYVAPHYTHRRKYIHTKKKDVIKK